MLAESEERQPSQNTRASRYALIYTPTTNGGSWPGGSVQPLHLEVILETLNGLVTICEIPISKLVQLITSVQIRCTDSNPSGAGPDVSGCSGLYGTVIRPPCEVALDGLPTGSLPTIFTTKTRIAGGNFVTLPKRYVDSDRPSCAITIDLDGHSQKDIFVLVPWNAIRRIVENILDDCVDRNFWGGFQTFGLQRSFDAFVESASRVKDSPPYAQVEQPDGAVDTSVVAMPQKTPPKSLDVPAYMVVSVSGPRTRAGKENTDFSIGLSLRDMLRQKYVKSSDVATQDGLARLRETLTLEYTQSLSRFDHHRWWEIDVAAPTVVPKDINYQCEATLGNPSIANCESVLYEFLRDGNVVLDPSSPIIKQSGNCAIGISATTRHVTTWSILRSVAEVLLVQCISGPLAGKIGGTATGQGIPSGRRKRQTTTTSTFPFQLSVYLQPPFNGPADQTCAWKAVHSDQGDVRTCPATTDFWRPPARRLGSDPVTIHSGNITEVLNGTALEISTGNFTETIHGNLTDLEYEAQALIPAASVEMGALSSTSTMSSTAMQHGRAGITTVTGAASTYTPTRNLGPCTELSC